MSTEPQLPITQEGRTWAYLSYASVFVGFPLFVVPFIQRNDAFALYHAKQAAVAYLLWVVLLMVYFTISMVTCGLGFFLFPMVMLPYVPMIHGFILVSNGEQTEPIGVLGFGDSLFAGVTVDSAKSDK
ncbi:MAG: hypothetical protein Q8P18_05165 [Pseudomonadota bacterium]|nr:hypothetical protein [Pseudomonadota bacterium]